MSRDSRVAVGLLGVGVALGIAADLLFRGRPAGLNVLLFALAFVAGLAVLLRVGRAPLHQGRRWMALPLLAFSGAFVWHDSPLLAAANAFALAGAVALGALRRAGPVEAGVGDYAEGLTAAGAGALAGSLALLQREVPWSEAGRSLRGPRTAAVARGLLLGLPLLLVFGGLFLAADTVFARLVTSAVPDVPGLWSHAALVGVVAYLAAGLLRDLVAPRTTIRALAVPRLGPTEVAVALGAVNVLFAGFVAVQARYLFGHEVIARLSYAQYARHGFFELVAVSVLVLPVVLAANALAPSRRVRVLSAVLLALEVAVAASALDRLRLYQQQFGLTELRIYTTGVVLWLVCVFAWLAVTTLRGRRHFAVGALALGFAATAALNVVNPDALIARTNLSRPHVDVAYLAGLSDDAVPTLVARWSTLPPRLRRALVQRTTPHDGALSWNLSRERARKALSRAATSSSLRR
jgi:hypothetical protein